LISLVVKEGKRMGEACFSTIKKGETGKLLEVSVPCDLSTLDTEEDLAFSAGHPR
jgi:hypothetical protein